MFVSKFQVLKLKVKGLIKQVLQQFYEFSKRSNFYIFSLINLYGYGNIYYTVIWKIVGYF